MAAGALLSALAGAGIAGWHVRLQLLPAEQVPACGPGLEFITTQQHTDIQAQTEQLLADGRVERAASAYGMVLVPSDALRTIRLASPKARQTG